MKITISSNKGKSNHVFYSMNKHSNQIIFSRYKKGYILDFYSIYWLCPDVLLIGIVFDPIVEITIWQFVNAMQIICIRVLLVIISSSNVSVD